MLRMVIAVALALALWGCPSSTTTYLASASAPPAWRIDFRHGTINGTPTSFIQQVYRVHSGAATVWEITLDTSAAGCNSGGDSETPEAWHFPEEIQYGVAPVCYRETVAATSLEEGRAYMLTSDDERFNHSLHAIRFPFMVERGQVRTISSGRYAEMTGTAD